MISPSYLPRVWIGSNVSTRFLPSTVKPLSAHIKLTENCQAKCVSCDYWKSRWQDEIDTARAIGLINEIEAAGIRTLRLTGGEPLLRKDLFHVLMNSNASRFKSVILQTNGLLIKKLHAEINASPITKVAVSIDGLKQTNDAIRGIRGYFDLGMEGIQLLRGKKIAISLTLNRMAASELEELEELARKVGAELEFNILSQSLFFLKRGDISSLWPEQEEVSRIARFLTGRRPQYEVDYVRGYYSREQLEEPPCVLGYLQVFVLSNGDVLTGCYPLAPVGNILRDDLATILASEAYSSQAEAMIRRECPGCTCGVESSLAVKHGLSSAMFELSRMRRSEGHHGSPQQGGGENLEYLPGSNLVQIGSTAAQTERRH